MKLYRSLKYIIIFSLVLSLFTACKTGKQVNNDMMVNNIQATNPDEEAIYSILTDLKEYISTSQWDKWLSLYTDDAILTSGKEKIDKTEMRKLVDGITYKITEMEVLKTKIDNNMAYVSVRMIGNGKKHFETYKLKKDNGQWLITEETNP